LGQHYSAIADPDALRNLAATQPIAPSLSLAITGRSSFRFPISRGHVRVSHRVAIGQRFPVKRASGGSILRPFAGRRHLDQPRIETAKHVDQIRLRSHDLMDVLVNPGHFVQSRGDKGNSFFG
jgi:hypothetical protein